MECYNHKFIVIKFWNNINKDLLMKKKKKKKTFVSVVLSVPELFLVTL